MAASPRRARGGSGLAAVVALLGCGCTDGSPRDEGSRRACEVRSADPGALPREGFCGAAEGRLGHRVCVHAVPDAATWSAITFPVAAVDQKRTTTYLVPAREDARVPAVLVDANAFEAPEQSLHHKFLTGSVPELALLAYPEYLELVLDPARREWFAGSLTEYLVPGSDGLLGFTIWDQGADPAGTVTCEQFQRVHAELEGRSALGLPVAAVPANDLQRAVLASCDVCVHDPSLAVDYEAYTQGSRCGTLRRYTLGELAGAELRAEIGWQDILVTDQAPLDIQTVIAGIVTGTRQGELSHLNVRSASRGTPNCYVKDAFELLARWDGQLVELECGPDGATVRAVTPEEAIACNEGFRPEPVTIAPPDLTVTDLVPLLEVPTATPEERRVALQRFGAKGANLATLYQRIDRALQLEGFLLPVHHYDAFVRGNSWTVDLGAGPEVLSFAATIERLLADPAFLADGAIRRDRLGALQAAMTAAPCDPALLAALAAQIPVTFGQADVMVRLRSSSNAEDALGFNGAGLYDSTSACLADETDGDSLGPSHCDPDKNNERGICEGLKVVWASLWNMKAFEERSWYGIDHAQVVMGILVDTRTKGELANIVAFSGNPLLRGDRRYLVNAQLGELDVVSAVPGMWPEKDLLTIEEGAVTLIERARGSTELPEGQWVLDDARLRELGAALSAMVGPPGLAPADRPYPLDVDVPPTARIYLDTEWKITAEGRLIVKQVRPFLE